MLLVVLTMLDGNKNIEIHIFELNILHKNRNDCGTDAGVYVEQNRASHWEYFDHSF